jgi:DNA-sulfur modification-associated
MEVCPALQARMGDWEYFIAVMPFGEIANRVRYAHELHPYKELDEQIKRELDERVRVNQMVRYLLRQEQHFYGALVIAVYGGEPKFQPVKMAEHPLLVSVRRTARREGLDGERAGQAAAAVRGEVAQAQGSRSSIRLIGCSAMRARTSRR